jgi:hypothetical protein
MTMARRHEEMLITAVMSAVADGLFAGFDEQTEMERGKFFVRFSNALSAGLRKRGVPHEVATTCRRTITDSVTEPCGETERRVKSRLPGREDPDVR